jgi:hypothetical protein
MARKAILFYMEAQQRGSEEAKESLLEKRLRKMEDRLAKMISRTMIDIGIVNQVFYKRASKEERDKLWDAAKTAALERLRFKRKDGDQEATGVIRDVPHSSEG